MANGKYSTDSARYYKGYIHAILGFGAQHVEEDYKRVAAEIGSKYGTFGEKPFTVVFHQDDRPGNRNHIHIMYYHYRGCPTTRFLRSTARDFGLYWGWCGVLSYIGLSEYLQKGPGKFLLGNETSFKGDAGRPYGIPIEPVDNESTGCDWKTPQSNKIL